MLSEQVNKALGTCKTTFYFFKGHLLVSKLKSIHCRISVSLQNVVQVVMITSVPHLQKYVGLVRFMIAEKQRQKELQVDVLSFVLVGRVNSV